MPTQYFHGLKQQSRDFEFSPHNPTMVGTTGRGEGWGWGGVKGIGGDWKGWEGGGKEGGREETQF